jgi:hypothetical protein
MRPHDLAQWHEQMRLLATSPAIAYARAVQTERARPRMDQAGYRLYVVGRDAVHGRDIGVQAGGHIIVGRHTHCDFIVEEHEDTAISLRHVLLRAISLDDGLPVLTVLDLDSRSGFELSDGSRQRSVVVSGPIVFRIGASWFVALPSGEAVPDLLEPPLVKNVDEGGYKVNPRKEEFANAMRARLPTARITLIPRPVALSNRSSMPYIGVTEESLPSSQYEPESIASLPYEVLVYVDGECAAVRFSESDIEHGILIGRADKCVDAGLRAVMNRNIGISRVHLLFIRERDGIKVYDVSSTNGTTNAAHQKIRTMTLADKPGDQTTVFMRGSAKTMVRWRVLDKPTA